MVACFHAVRLFIFVLILWKLQPHFTLWLSDWVLRHCSSDVSESFLSSQSHKALESESSKIFSSRIRVTTWSSRVRVESQELSSHFESLVCNCKLESMSSHTKFHVFFYDTFLLWNGTHHAIKWRPISSKMVPNVVLTSLIAGYLYLTFLSLHFTFVFHSQSFQKVYLNLAASVAASQLALWWKCASPRKGCVWRTTPICCEQAEIKWARRGIFIVACCHSVKLCALAAQPSHSQQMVLWPECESVARRNRHKKNVQWVRPKRGNAVRGGFRERGALGHLSFGGPAQVWPLWPFV